MSNRLHIQGEYPADWDQIGDRVREEAGHRCIRCGHPYRTGAHGKGQWTPCDEHCSHAGPLAFLIQIGDSEEQFDPYELSGRSTAGELARKCAEHGADTPVAEWRILTVHHLDGNKSNCEWWNLLALCQRCHLQIQTRVTPMTPWFLEHSEWFKPYVAGFYAHKYEGRNITRDEATRRLDELLAYERLA
jgi:hypothetical protein